MALSPMMKQYFDIKESHQDCILFFRVGDFYEMFFDDAKLASKELELTLTGKACGLEGSFMYGEISFPSLGLSFNPSRVAFSIGSKPFYYGFLQRHFRCLSVCAIVLHNDVCFIFFL